MIANRIFFLLILNRIFSVFSLKIITSKNIYDNTSFLKNNF